MPGCAVACAERIYDTPGHSQPIRRGSGGSGAPGGLGGVPPEMDVIAADEAHGGGDQGVTGDLSDLAVHLGTDAPVAGVALRGGAQLDEVHRLAGVEPELVSQPVAQG